MGLPPAVSSSRLQKKYLLLTRPLDTRPVPFPGIETVELASTSDPNTNPATATYRRTTPIPCDTKVLFHLNTEAIRDPTRTGVCNAIVDHQVQGYQDPVNPGDH